MASHAKLDYLAFANEHGGDDSKVQIEDGYFLFPDGAFLTLRSGQYADASYGYPEAPLYSGPQRIREVQRQVARNIATYWDTCHMNAVAEFRELRRAIKAEIRETNTPGDPDDLERLRQLAADVKRCRKALNRAVRAAERLEPGYRTPAQQREDERYESVLSEAVATFEQQLNAITF